MKFTITHSGGLMARPHLNATLERANRWIELIPRGIRLTFIGEQDLPHTPNIWGHHNTVKRHWSIRFSSSGTSNNSNICVCLVKTYTDEDEYLFERDIITAILLIAFKEKVVTDIIRKTNSEWSAVRYHIGRPLAEDIASFIVNEDKVMNIDSRIYYFARNLNRNLIELQLVHS